LLVLLPVTRLLLLVLIRQVLLLRLPIRRPADRRPQAATRQEQLLR